MKKRLSNILAVLLVLATMIGGAISSFAAPDDTGNLHIHKYWVDDKHPYPTGIENNGDEQNGITNPPVSGVGFDVYKIGDLELVNGNLATSTEKEQHTVPQGGLVGPIRRQMQANLKSAMGQLFIRML